MYVYSAKFPIQVYGQLSGFDDRLGTWERSLSDPEVIPGIWGKGILELLFFSDEAQAGSFRA